MKTETITITTITEEELRAILLKLGAEPTHFLDCYGDLLEVATGYELDTVADYTIEEAVHEIWRPNPRNQGGMDEYQVAALLAEAASRGFCPKTDYIVEY